MPVSRFNKAINVLDPLRQYYARAMRRRGKNRFTAFDSKRRFIDSMNSLEEFVIELEQRKRNLIDANRDDYCKQSSISLKCFFF